MTFEEWRNSLPTPFGKLEAETVWQAKEAIERERAKELVDALESIADVSMGRHKSTYDMLIWHGKIARAAIAKYEASHES